MIQKPNYTQIPNVYFDSIMQTLNGSENLVFLAIMRKTFGWQKKKDRISYSQIMGITGLAKSTTSLALKTLDERGLIITEKHGQDSSYYVNITDETVPEIEPVRKSNCTKNRTGTVPKIVPVESKTVPKIEHTKESELNKLSKEIYTEMDNVYIEEYTKKKGIAPIIVYPALRNRQKYLLENGITKENIISAIKQAATDEWIQKCGFDIMTILGNSVLPRLINQAGVKTVSVQPVPKQNSHPCPKCGQPMTGLSCKHCFSNFDSEGNEV